MHSVKAQPQADGRQWEQIERETREDELTNLEQDLHREQPDRRRKPKRDKRTKPSSKPTVRDDRTENTDCDDGR